MGLGSCAVPPRPMMDVRARLWLVLGRVQAWWCAPADTNNTPRIPEPTVVGVVNEAITKLNPNGINTILTYLGTQMWCENCNRSTLIEPWSKGRRGDVFCEECWRNFRCDNYYETQQMKLDREWEERRDEERDLLWA